MQARVGGVRASLLLIAACAGLLAAPPAQAGGASGGEAENNRRPGEDSMGYEEESGEMGSERATGSLPGADPMPPDLSARLAAALAAQGEDSVPRTEHLREDGSPRYTNRLILETSPYLLQHAHNPVDWYPWGEEAFARARELGRPVFLSVGYSTCHWCHVMERESFEDEEIARFLNENYVAVKVDREERPDVDSIYMTAVQILTRQGGWPMSVWLTPDREPFYGGTYFPPRDGDRGARYGFLTMLRELRRAWDEQRDGVVDRATQLAAAIERGLASGAEPFEGLPAASLVEAAARSYRDAFDEVHGGLDRAPKFPSSLSIRLLLRAHRRTGEAAYLDMAALTLEKMAAGGIHDQVGGGFHRYSTDAEWLVPHFEKMLYDNALLTVAYLEGYQATGRHEFADTARGVLDYVLREMTSPGGAFYSATDADSPTPSGESEEGWFFTWTPEELAEVLGEEAARVVGTYYDVTAEGNFEGRGIPHRPRPAAAVAAELEIPEAELAATVERSLPLLYEARLRRPPPLLDDKILTSWNGLMISAFATAGAILGEPAYVDAAERAAAFLLTEMRPEGELRRIWRDGAAKQDAFLDDFSFLVAGLLDLCQAAAEPRWLREAIALQAELDEQHWDERGGGYFLTPDDGESLLARERPTYDGAEPSGNSVALLNLLRLAELTTDDAYRRRADEMLSAFARTLAQAPTGMAEMLVGLDFRHGRPKEIVLVTPGERRQAEPFLEVLRRTYLPHKVVVTAAAGEEQERFAEVVPFLEGKEPLDGLPTAYVCERHVCQLPTTDVEVFERQLAE